MLAQIPYLMKMKQSLNAQCVSFTRMASDALIEGWDPDFECDLAQLHNQVLEVKRLEQEIADLDASIDCDMFDGMDESEPVDEFASCMAHHSLIGN
jgi:hypothetical protein